MAGFSAHREGWRARAAIYMRCAKTSDKMRLHDLPCMHPYHLYLQQLGIFCVRFLSPMLQQRLLVKLSFIYLRRLPSDKVLLARSPSAMIHVPFTHNYPFPALLLVDDTRPWEVWDRLIIRDGTLTL